MRELKREEIEYAIGRLEVYMTSRGLNQSDLEDLSGVEQSTISKILHRKQEPSLDNLQKLFGGLGLQLPDVLSAAADRLPKILQGYLATPLTGLSERGGCFRPGRGRVRTPFRRCCGILKSADRSLLAGRAHPSETSHQIQALDRLPDRPDAGLNVPLSGHPVRRAQLRCRAGERDRDAGWHARHPPGKSRGVADDAGIVREELRRSLYRQPQGGHLLRRGGIREGAPLCCEGSLLARRAVFEHERP